MAQVQIASVVRVVGADDLVVTGTVNGQQVMARGWVSAMIGMTPAQRLTYVATLLRDAWRASLSPPTADVNVTGSTTLPD